MINELFVEEYGKKLSQELSGFDGVPTFDTRFIAMGLGIEHDALLRAIYEHKEALNEYGEIAVIDGAAKLTAVQAIAAVLFIDDTWPYSKFLAYPLYETLYERTIVREGQIDLDDRCLALLWGKVILALDLLAETHATVGRFEGHRSPELAAELEKRDLELVDEALETASLAHPGKLASAYAGILRNMLNNLLANTLAAMQ